MPAGAAVLVATVACTETTVCPAVAVAALRITFENLPAAECPKVVIDVRDGDFAETVSPRLVGDVCEARAAIERTGEFSVTVRAAGRPTRSWTGVRVGADASCGTPITQRLTVTY